MGNVKIWHDAFATGIRFVVPMNVAGTVQLFPKSRFRTTYGSVHQQFEESTIKEAEGTFKFRHGEEIFLQILQNNAARIILDMPKYFSASKALEQ